MKIQELKAKYPSIIIHDSYPHRQKADPTAEAEIWHNLLSYRGYKFASHIHEYLYADGTSKLFIMYTSLDRKKFDDVVGNDDFMGDFARRLQLMYPSLDDVLGKGLQQLDTEDGLRIFDAIIKHLDTLPDESVKIKYEIMPDDEEHE